MGAPSLQTRWCTHVLLMDLAWSLDLAQCNDGSLSGLGDVGGRARLLQDAEPTWRSCGRSPIARCVHVDCLRALSHRRDDVVAAQGEWSSAHEGRGLGLRKSEASDVYQPDVNAPSYKLGRRAVAA